MHIEETPSIVKSGIGLLTNTICSVKELQPPTVTKAK